MVIPAIVLASCGSLIDIDATILIQFAIFIFLFIILWRFLFRPTIRLIEARREATEGVLINAKKMDEEASGLSEEVEKRLGEVRSMASSERDQMVDRARAQERELLAKAREDARSMVDNSRKEMAEQSEAARQALKGETAVLADSVAAKILGRQL